MNPDQLNLEQWRNEIATFVSETRNELRELRDALSAHVAQERVQSDPAVLSLNDQLASLERNIADRLGQGAESEPLANANRTAEEAGQ